MWTFHLQYHKLLAVPMMANFSSLFCGKESRQSLGCIMIFSPLCNLAGSTIDYVMFMNEDMMIDLL